MFAGRFCSRIPTRTITWNRTSISAACSDCVIAAAAGRSACRHVVDGEARRRCNAKALARSRALRAKAARVNKSFHGLSRDPRGERHSVAARNLTFVIVFGPCDHVVHFGAPVGEAPNLVLLRDPYE